MLPQLHRVVGVLVCALLLARPANSDKIKRSVPLSAATWTADLRKYGYDDQRVIWKAPLWTFHTADWFPEEEKLIATFVTREAVTGLQRRSDPHHEFPYKLHAVVLDATSGKTLLQSSWGSDYYQVGLVGRQDGSFAVFLGDHIDFYSADFRQQNELKLPQVTDLGGQENELAISNSASGTTLLIQYRDGNRNECLLIVGEAVSPSQPPCEPVAAVPMRAGVPTLVFGAAISDSEIATAVGRDWDSLRITVRTFTDLPVGGFKCAGCYLADFISEDTLLVWQGSSVWLVGSDGKLLWRQDIARAEGEIFSYDRKARLLALPFQNPRAASVLSSVVVYDLSKHKEMFRVKTATRDNRLHGLAISPSGKRFMVDIGGVLHCYSLPSMKR